MSTDPKAARKRAILYIITFIMGGCGIAYEYTFSKMSSDLMGNSVRQWAITIGLMMFFMGVGSDLQKHLKDKGLFDKFIFFEVMLGLIGGFGPVLLLWLFGVARDHYVLAQYSLIISTGFLIGLEIPILVRINERFTKELRVNLGGILRMDYIGAFTGAMLWAFIFIVSFDLMQIGFVLGVFNTITAGLALAYFHKLSEHKTPLAVITVLCGVALTYGWIKAPEWTKFAEQNLYFDKIIYADSTKYQHIVLTQSANGEIYCYINGNTQFSSFDEHIYHEFLVHPAMQLAKQRDRVLILGGGDALGLREVLKYPDVKEVTLVDLDPGMTQLAATHPDLRRLNQDALTDARVKVLENRALTDTGEVAQVMTPDRTRLLGQGEVAPTAEVNLVHYDAALFIDQIAGYYDVIIIDFPDPNNLELAKLYSRSFYTKVRSKLSKHGIVVQQSTSPVHSKEAFLCIGRTLEASGLSVVPFHENVPVFGDWGFWLGGRDDTYGVESLREGLTTMAEIDVPVRHITKELVAASLVFGKEALQTQQTQINTLLNNSIYLYYSDALTSD